MIFAVDPGNVESAYVLTTNDLVPIEFGKVTNEELLKIIYDHFTMWKCQDGTFKSSINHVAIEMVASYGMAVGKSVFDTCVWIGRFHQAILEQAEVESTFIYRKDEKMTLCHSMKAKDSNITQALIDRFAPNTPNKGKGVKANKGFFYGFKKDIWQAFAVAVTYHDLYINPCKLF